MKIFASLNKIRTKERQSRGGGGEEVGDDGVGGGAVEMGGWKVGVHGRGVLGCGDVVWYSVVHTYKSQHPEKGCTCCLRLAWAT